MTLLDRFVTAETKPKIPIHAFMGAIHLAKTNKITVSQIKNGFNLDSTDDQQLTIMLTLDYQDLKAVFYLWESRIITKSQAKTILGL